MVNVTFGGMLGSENILNYRENSQLLNLSLLSQIPPTLENKKSQLKHKIIEIVSHGV